MFECVGLLDCLDVLVVPFRGIRSQERNLLIPIRRKSCTSGIELMTDEL